MSTKSFLRFGVVTSMPLLVKIYQEMRPWHRDKQNCPMVYAIHMVVKWRHISMVAIRSPFCRSRPSYCRS